MAYNKSKYVEAAQKLLNQGKVPQAIAEYQLILKYEPKDQVTLMTIGELYIRQGETFQAIDYFERLAQIFVGDGFLTKAIAVYKRIAKLAPEEIRPLEKLADLYVQQGVMSEARPLFLQLAEIHLKHHRQTEAVALLKKLLLAEPDNLRIQIRLADLYQVMGKPNEAVETYVSAAQRALARGDHAESDKQSDKALKLDSANAAALTVKARSASSQGRFADAAAYLKNLPGLDKGGEQSEFLLDLYLKSSNWDEATALALKVFDGDEKNFGLAQKVAESLLESEQNDRALALVSRLRIPMLDSGEHDAVTQLLNELAAKMPGRLEPLKWLVDSYGRTSDSFRMPDALAQLGDALVTANQLARAKEIFEQLVDRQPESDSSKRKLNDVLRRMGLPAPEDEPEPVQETLQAEIPRLEEIHKERGDAAGAERFGELRRRFQRAAGLSDEEIAAAANPSAPAASVAASSAADKETRDELPIPVEEMAQAPVSSGVPPPPKPEPSKPVHEVDLSDEWASLLEQAAANDAPAPVPPIPSAAVTNVKEVAPASQTLASAAPEELTASFSEPAAKENAPIAAAKAEAPASPAEQDHLKEVFDDFRAEIGEMGAEDEDLETHYNLGIAFREMGLLEEAISEFQKVAKANEKGKAFRYAMQCCTLLGLAFMEKGQPSIAAIWYERALRTPGVDAESTLALRYDLGVAQESANDLDAALKSFSQVYAVNIDYRGVADRIAALQKTTR